MRAARYLGVAPWDLARQPKVWTTWANLSESAEIEARAAVRQQAEGGMRG